MACDMIYSGMSFTEMIDFSLFGEKCEIVQGGVWEIGKETENGFRIRIDWADWISKRWFLMNMRISEVLLCVFDKLNFLFLCAFSNFMISNLQFFWEIDISAVFEIWYKCRQAKVDYKKIKEIGVSIRENWNRREQREEIRLRNLLWVSGNILIFQKF